MQRPIFCLLLVLLMTGFGWGQTTSPATQPSRAGKAAIVPIEEGIDDYTFKKLSRRIEQAKADGVDTLILKINTPGGSVGATFDITRLLKKEAANFHTVAYIDEMAYSAGTMIAVACNEIVMSKQSMIGDCAPILPTGQGLAEITGANRAKIESPLVAEFEDSAARNGYDPLLLRAFVQYQLSIYVLENAEGKRLFAGQDTYKDYLDQGWKLLTGIKNPIDDELTLLTISNTTAEQLGLSKGTYESLEAFAASRGWTIAQDYKRTGGEAVIDILKHDSLRAILSTIFMLSLYLAINKPGSGIFEVALVISGVLLLGVPLMTGYAGWLEILLIVVGVAFLAVEIFIIPGFGFAGVTGILMILAGLVMTFVPSEGPALPNGPSVIPQLPQTRDGLKEGLILTLTGMIVALGLWFWLTKYLTRLPYVNRLVLQTTVGSTPEADTDPARELIESAWPQAGSRGVAVTELKPGGIARFFDPIINDDRNIDVISDNGFVVAGQAIEVRRKTGGEIIVRAMT